MKRMRRIIGVALSISLLAVGLAGCSSNNKGGTTDDDGIRVITLGRQISQNSKIPDGDNYEDNAYTRMVRDELGIQIVDEFEAYGEDYDRQVSLAMSAGQIPDIMKVGSYDELKELYENDLIIDLTEVYEAYGSDYLKSVFDSYDGRALEKATIDGKLMALPGTRVDAGPSMAWIRSDWMEQLNITVDASGEKVITIDELEMIARQFIENNPANAENVVGITFAPWLTSGESDGGLTMNSVAYAMGAYPKLWLEQNGQITYGSNSDEMKAALQKVADWYAEGIVDRQLGTRTWDDIMALLVNGQAGIAFGSWHMPDWGLNNVRAMDDNATFEAYAIAGADGKVNCTHSDAANGFIVVSKDCKYPEAAVQIINLFYDEMTNSSELLEKYPEVEQYIKDAVDGSARPFNIEINAYTSLLDDFSDIYRGVYEEITMDEVRTIDSKTNVISIQKYLADPENSELADWARYHSRMKGIGLLQELTDSNTYNWISPVYPETSDTMKTNKANLDKMEEEMFIKMATGAISVEEGFASYVEDWYALGGSQIISEIEAQIK